MGSNPPSSTRRADYSLAAGDGFDATHKQFNVDQFVLQDGRTYRTQEANQELQKSCTLLGDASLAFGVNHAACIMSKENNGWKPTRVSLLDDIQNACVEHGHGGIWNWMDYDTRGVVCIDMKAC